MLKEFRDFINRGNVIDLAVGIVIGTAFTAVVSSFVNDVLLQIVAAAFGEPDFSNLTFQLGDSTIFYGTFITTVITFVLVALAVFFVVKGFNRLREASRRRAEQGEEPAAPSDVDLLAEIRDLLRGRA